MKYLFLLLTLASCSFGMILVPEAPEIDGQSASSAIALVAGGLMVLRAARRRK